MPAYRPTCTCSIIIIIVYEITRREEELLRQPPAPEGGNKGLPSERESCYTDLCHSSMSSYFVHRPEV